MSRRNTRYRFFSFFLLFLLCTQHVTTVCAGDSTATAGSVLTGSTASTDTEVPDYAGNTDTTDTGNAGSADTTDTGNAGNADTTNTGNAGSADTTDADHAASVSAYPNDPYLDALWAYENPGFYTHYYGSFPVTYYSRAGIDMKIPTAWKNYPLKKEETRTVVIAVIDTGIDYRHPDLKDQMWINENEIPDNGIDDDGNGYVDDVYGWDFYNNDASICHYIETANGYTADPDDNDNHGTHIAGIIAATANNSIGIAGVASNVNIKIMSLKIHGGSSSSGSVANAIKAIQYAEAMGADICNISWGTTKYSQALELAIRESSMLFITAAGNDSLNINSTPVFPASLRLPNLISVANLNCEGFLSPSSNYGISTVDIAAPGESIYSTLVGSYGYSSGSSMAAPHVTGLAAMLYAYHENIYPAQVKELIINTMMPLDTLDGYLINPGIPDAAAAILAMSELEPDTEAPFLLLETTYDKDTLVVRTEAYDAGSSGIRKIRYAYGSRTADYFTSGSDSTAVLTGEVRLTKAGYYTFYVEDYAGNHSLYNYYVADDKQAPELTFSYQVTPDYSEITVHVSVSDTESGVKTVKYLVGEATGSELLLSGEDLDTSVNEYSIPVSPDTTALSFYLTDYRGNSTTYVIHPKILPATALYLNVTERSLNCSDSFQLQPLIFPWLCTDGVRYLSLNESVVTVSDTGLVTATGAGDTMVLVTTDSGISAVCTFHVPEPLPDKQPTDLQNGQSSNEQPDDKQPADPQNEQFSGEQPADRQNEQSPGEQPADPQNEQSSEKQPDANLFRA